MNKKQAFAVGFMSGATDDMQKLSAPWYRLDEIIRESVKGGIDESALGKIKQIVKGNEEEINKFIKNLDGYADQISDAAGQAGKGALIAGGGVGAGAGMAGTGYGVGRAAEGIRGKN